MAQETMISNCHCKHVYS